MALNPYFIACAVFMIVTIAMIVFGRYLWALPFAGSSLALYFLGMSRDAGGTGGGHAR